MQCLVSKYTTLNFYSFIRDLLSKIDNKMIVMLALNGPVITMGASIVLFFNLTLKSGNYLLKLIETG